MTTNIYIRFTCLDFFSRHVFYCFLFSYFTPETSKESGLWTWLLSVFLWTVKNTTHFPTQNKSQINSKSTPSVACLVVRLKCVYILFLFFSSLSQGQFCFFLFLPNCCAGRVMRVWFWVEVSVNIEETTYNKILCGNFSFLDNWARNSTRKQQVHFYKKKTFHYTLCCVVWNLCCMV